MIAWTLLLTQPQSLLYSEVPSFDTTKQNKQQLHNASLNNKLKMPWTKYEYEHELLFDCAKHYEATQASNIHM